MLLRGILLTLAALLWIQKHAEEDNRLRALPPQVPPPPPSRLVEERAVERAECWATWWKGGAPLLRETVAKLGTNPHVFLQHMLDH